MARKKDRLPSTRALVESITPSQRKMFGEDDLELYKELAAFAREDLRDLVDGVVGLKAAERKAYVEPYMDLYRAMKKAHKPRKRYSVPPFGTMRRITKYLKPLTVWLKSRHKYRDGELNAPATDEELLGLQDYFREATGDKEFLLPRTLIDSLRISNGVNVPMLMFHDTWVRLYSVDEIREAHQELLERFGDHPERVPFSPGINGNYLVTLRNMEVYDLNHEDGNMRPAAPGLYKVLSKAHKPQHS